MERLNEKAAAELIVNAVDATSIEEVGAEKIEYITPNDEQIIRMLTDKYGSLILKAGVDPKANTIGLAIIGK